MLNEPELRALLADLESDRIERTTSTTKTDKFGEAICAFANDFPNHRQPGYLIIGADDRGRPVGLMVEERLLLGLASIRSDGNVQPIPAIVVSKMTLPEGELAVVEVQPSDMPPVRYRGRVGIRVAPSRRQASESEERILSERRISSALTFDARPCMDCDQNDLNQDLFRQYLHHSVSPEVIRANNRDPIEQLASLRFFDLKKGCVTYAGLLLFGKNPLAMVPGAYVQFVMYQGENVTDLVTDEKKFSGDLLSVLREIDAFLPILIISRPQFVTAGREEIVQDYPRAALRELLFNAVMHRSYESTSPTRFFSFRNRIEIQNPGGLYGEANPENFPRNISYRNPVIAEAMKNLGYVNRFGRGVLTAREAMSQAGNPDLEFTFDPAHFAVTLRRRP